MLTKQSIRPLPAPCIGEALFGVFQIGQCAAVAYACDLVFSVPTQIYSPLTVVFSGPFMTIGS